MAKVGFWLRGARGKMGGAVLMKSENGTVARENVTPKNPRTSKQMYQRAIFATVASAAKAMKEIINHSFYGIADGNKCIQEFRKINLAKLRNKVAANIAGNLDLTDTVGALAPKDYKFIVPNEYQISSGTITSPVLTVDYSGNSLALTSPHFSFEDDQITVQQFLFKLLGVNPGEQLTLAAISVGDSTVIYEVPNHGDDIEGMYCYENSFKAMRLVFKDTASYDYSQLVNFTGSSTSDDLWHYINNCIDIEKSDAWLVDQIGSNLEFVVDQGVCTMGVDFHLPVNFRAAGIVRSVYLNGVWNYSTCIMKCAIPVEDANYGCNPENAVASYLNGVTVGESNDPFLDEGGNGGSLE